MPKQVPSVGRVVHYIAPEGKVFPALIVSVEEDGCVLTIFAPSEIHHVSGIKEGEQTGNWMFPPFVPPIPDEAPKDPPAKDIKK